jgi:hypothetical protein
MNIPEPQVKRAIEIATKEQEGSSKVVMLDSKSM